MATEYVSIEGRVYYPKINKPDVYSGDSRWIVAFAPTDFDDITNTGVGLMKRAANEYIPEDHVNIRRPVKRLFGDDLYFFTPPFIFDAEGKILRAFRDENGKFTRSYTKGNEPELEGEQSVNIPNGSLVALDLCIYDTSKGKGHRLETIRILDLAEATETKEIEKAAEPTTKTAKGAKTPW